MIAAVLADVFITGTTLTADGAAPMPAARPPLTSPAAILGLSATEIAAAPAAAVQGVATLVFEYAPGATCFTIQDDGRAVCVDGREYQRLLRAGGMAEPTIAFSPGSIVEVTGTVEPGALAPKIMAATIRVTGTAALPQPVAADLGRLFEGVDEGLRVSIEGTIEDIETRDQHPSWILLMRTGGHCVGIELPHREFPSSPRHLIDAEIRATGVVAAIRNSRGEPFAPKIIVARSEDLVVTTPAPESPFSCPHVPLDEIARFHLDSRRGHRLRTEGVVTRAFPRTLFLFDGAGGVRVDFAADQESIAFAPGDRVEVAGFLQRARGIAGLTSARAWRLASGSAPLPLDVTVQEILAADLRSRDLGTMQRPGNHDGCLVRCRGVVESMNLLDDTWRATLSSGSQTFYATLPTNRSAVMSARLAPGSEVELTGIVQVDLDAGGPGSLFVEDPLARSFTVLLSAPSDIAVLRAPPFWTSRRLAAMAGLLFSLLAAAGIWTFLLRREVRKQTLRAVGEAAARRQADLEYEVSLRERNRLAADLHDTILQSVTGIGLQLQACEETRVLAAAGEHTATALDGTLESAQEMVEHAIGQLRSAVWSLRTQPASGMMFSEAVRDMVGRHHTGRAVHIAATIDPAADQLPAHLAGGLLQIIKEAVNNSLHHARPHAIDVRVGVDTARDVVIASVADDGVGFQLGRQAGPARRHFGLTGMRERAAEIDGSLEIRTSPGAGTTIVVSAPLAGSHQ